MILTHLDWGEDGNIAKVFLGGFNVYTGLRTTVFLRPRELSILEKVIIVTL